VPNGSTSHACRQVDKRADLWAFGCVLYEMLAGRRAFDGRTPTDVLVSVIGRDPDWSALPSATPATVRGLVRQCLQQDARQRLEWDLAE
jgi:serine/threonine protein kinase